MKQFKKNLKKYKVLTDSGFQNFSGIALMGTEPTITLYFSNNENLECTSNHKLYVSESDYKTAEELTMGRIAMNIRHQKKPMMIGREM